MNDIGRASLRAPCVGGADMMSGYRTRFEGLGWNITCTIFRVLEGVYTAIERSHELVVELKLWYLLDTIQILVDLVAATMQFA